MPTYDYKCDMCNFEFEQKQKMSDLDSVMVQCPLCGSDLCVRKITGGTGFILGDCFYFNGEGRPSIGNPSKFTRKK